jgi:hypothetical protein
LVLGKPLAASHLQHLLYRLSRLLQKQRHKQEEDLLIPNLGTPMCQKLVSWEKGPEDNPPSGCMMVNHGQTNAAS